MGSEPTPPSADEEASSLYSFLKFIVGVFCLSIGLYSVFITLAHG